MILFSPPSGVDRLAPRCTRLSDLYIDSPKCGLPILNPLIAACSSSLQRVIVDCQSWCDTEDTASASSLLWLVSLHCKSVRSVELLHSRVLTEKNTKVMWHLTSGLPDVAHFASLAKNSVTRESVELMAVAWKRLSCLRLHFGAMDMPDLIPLRSCPELSVLELVGGDFLSPHELLSALVPVEDDELAVTSSSLMSAGQMPVFLPTVEVLVLSSVRVDPAAVALLVTSCPRLRRLVLRGCGCGVCEGTCREVVEAAKAGAASAAPSAGEVSPPLPAAQTEAAAAPGVSGSLPRMGGTNAMAEEGISRDQPAAQGADERPRRHTQAAESTVGRDQARVEEGEDGLENAADPRISSEMMRSQYSIASDQVTWAARACLRTVAEELVFWLSLGRRGGRVSVCLGAGGAAGCTAAVCDACCSL